MFNRKLFNKNFSVDSKHDGSIDKNRSKSVREQGQKSAQKNHPAIRTGSVESKQKRKDLNKDAQQALEALKTLKVETAELKVENEELRSKLSDRNQEKEEIIAYLKRTVEEKDDEVAILEDKVRVQAREFENDKRNLLKRFENQRYELKGSLTDAKHERLELATRMAALSDVTLERETLKHKVKLLQDQLDTLNSNWETKLVKIETEALRKNDELKVQLENLEQSLLLKEQEYFSSQVAEENRRIAEENKQLRNVIGKNSEIVKELQSDIKNQKAEMQSVQKALDVEMNKNQDLRENIALQSQKFKDLEDNKVEELRSSKLDAELHRKTKEHEERLRDKENALEECMSTMKRMEQSFKVEFQKSDEKRQELEATVNRHKTTSREIQAVLKEMTGSIRNVPDQNNEDQKRLQNENRVALFLKIAEFMSSIDHS